jgi:phosphoribosyl-ATP pyrophosphohydrolase
MSCGTKVRLRETRSASCTSRAIATATRSSSASSRTGRPVTPAGSYSASLFEKGRDAIVKKIGEEAVEVIIAAKGEGRDRMISEIADLVFHVSVLMADEGLEWRDIEAELAKRAR